MSPRAAWKRSELVLNLAPFRSDLGGIEIRKIPRDLSEKCDFEDDK